MKKPFIYLLFLLCILSSCNTSRKVVYIQDAQDDFIQNYEISKGIVIQPKDMLAIVVSCRNPELAAAFNLATVSYLAGNEGGTPATQRLLGYVVNNEGYIDFPVLGSLRVTGLTRWELADMIKNRLVDEDLLKEPIVTVEFQNFRISIMGEVNAPGTYTVNGDKVTILEALSLAKDLTILGRRDDIAVIREKDGARNIHRVNILSTELFDSPVYYLQQNDIIYVEPNKIRAGQSRMNENSFKSVSLWVSIASFITTIIAVTK